MRALVLGLALATSAPAFATSVCLVTTSGYQGVLVVCDGVLVSQVPMTDDWKGNLVTASNILKDLIAKNYRVVGMAAGANTSWTLQRD